MKVLVTGGAGYMGTELINLLVSNEAVEKVIVYDNLSRMNYNLFLGLKLQRYPKLVFVKGELLDSRSLKKALKDIDVVYHMAAKVTTPFASFRFTCLRTGKSLGNSRTCLCRGGKSVRLKNLSTRPVLEFMDPARSRRMKVSSQTLKRFMLFQNLGVKNMCAGY